MTTRDNGAMIGSLRRIVTGHDAQGRAGLLIDETTALDHSLRVGCHAAVIWTTEGLPPSNDGSADQARRLTATTIEGGIVFRVIDYAPGVAPRAHRTDSVDFAVVMSGAIRMELDDGAFVDLKAGDVLVQRGTMHNWVNLGPEVCRIAFVLVSAKPATGPDGPIAAVG